MRTVVAAQQGNFAGVENLLRQQICRQFDRVRSCKQAHLVSVCARQHVQGGACEGQLTSVHIVAEKQEVRRAQVQLLFGGGRGWG